jgi:NitT/TauT family transport system substrate-binding protein
MRLSRRFVLSLAMLAAGVSLAAGTAPQAFAQSKKELLVAEPNRNAGYLPLYVAIRKGFFGDGVDVKVITTRGGAEHTNMVLTKRAFAFIGGPEHNAFAKAKGAELRAVVNVVDRGNIYFVARTGVEPPASHDWKSFLKDKRIATGIYGGTPNSITRMMVMKNGLDPRKDVQLIETESSAIMAAVKAGAADIAAISEPNLTQGIRNGLWGEPFYNVPKEFGPYAYSTFNVHYDSIKNDPQLVEAFVRGIVRGLKFVYEDKAGALEIAKLEFPTMPAEDMKAFLDRMYADQLWSTDGMVSRESWDTGKSVVRAADVLKSDVPYDDIIDMSFVQKALAEPKG